MNESMPMSVLPLDMADLNIICIALLNLNKTIEMGVLVIDNPPPTADELKAEAIRIYKSISRALCCQSASVDSAN